jgi:hypothetical protein
MTTPPRFTFVDDDADPRADGTSQASGPGEEHPQPPPGPDFNVILGAPDFTALIKRPETQKSREYERRTASALKLVVVGSIQAGQLPDAATVLYHGPGFAKAVGQLADASETAQKIVDAFTSPNSPWAMFALTAVPMVAQLFRNHEDQLQQVPSKIAFSRKARQMRKEAKQAQPKPPPRFTFRILGKQIPVRFRMRFNLGRVFAGVRTQTRDPNEIALGVFTDERLLSALAKQGINIAVVPRDQ